MRVVAHIITIRITIYSKYFLRPTHTFKEEATMSYTVRRSGSRPPEKLTAIIQILGHELPFRLYSRPLRLGPYGVVQYYWMDGSQFRSIKSDASAANFRNCTGHWAASMRQS